MRKLIYISLFVLLRTCVGDEVEDCPNIIARDKWASVPPKSVNYLIIPIPYVIIHHTATPECNTKNTCSDEIENIRSFHMDTNGWTDIGYSFLIGGDGNVYEGCGWNQEGAHAYGYNKKSLGIAFIGTYQNKGVTDVMLDAAHKLILCGKKRGILKEDVRVLGAKQVISTVSPGAQLYEQIRNWEEWSALP